MNQTVSANTVARQRIQGILTNLDAVGEDLFALSDDIWLEIDHNDSDAVEKGAAFKIVFNKTVAEFRQISDRLSQLGATRRARRWPLQTINELRFVHTEPTRAVGPKRYAFSDCTRAGSPTIDSKPAEGVRIRLVWRSPPEQQNVQSMGYRRGRRVAPVATR